MAEMLFFHAASLAGFLKFVRGEAHLTWEPLRDDGHGGENRDQIELTTNKLLREQSS